MSINNRSISQLVRRVIVFMVLGLASIVNADTLVTGPFRLEQRKRLELSYHKQPLIVSDSLYPLIDWQQANAPRVDQLAKAQVLNIIKKSDSKLAYRKEVAMREDGVVELTIKVNAPPFNGKSSGYKILIPLDVLDNSDFRAVAGRAFQTKEYSGKIARNMPEGQIISESSQVRYVAFKSERIKLVFDFNPYGVQQMYTEGEVLIFE